MTREDEIVERFEHGMGATFEQTEWLLARVAALENVREAAQLAHDAVRRLVYDHPNDSDVMACLAQECAHLDSVLSAARSEM